MNLLDDLQQSLGDGPAHRPVEQRIAAGRRLMWRRRAASGVAALSVVALLGTGYAVLSPDERAGRTGPEVADGPSREPSREERLAPHDLRIGPAGELQHGRAVEILESVPNPFGYGGNQPTYGVRATIDGAATWALVDRSGSIQDEPFRSMPTFEYWLEDAVALQEGRPQLELVRFADGERLVPRPGVELLQQTGDVDLGPNFAGPDDRTAVAEVTFDGRRWYVVARQLDGSRAEYFPTAAEVSRPTLERFLPYARTAYDNQEGLR